MATPKTPPPPPAEPCRHIWREAQSEKLPGHLVLYCVRCPAVRAIRLRDLVVNAE